MPPRELGGAEDEQPLFLPRRQSHAAMLAMRSGHICQGSKLVSAVAVPAPEATFEELQGT